MEVSGVGSLLLASYGSALRYDVAPGVVRTVDRGEPFCQENGCFQYESLISNRIRSTTPTGRAHCAIPPQS